MITRQSRPWVGWWIVGVGILHTLFGLVVYSAGWRAIHRLGWWNAVDGDIAREHAFWFTLLGPATVLLGALMVWVERQAGVRLPRLLGWSLLAAVLASGFLMPVSGMWLLVPPAIGLLRR